MTKYRAPRQTYVYTLRQGEFHKMLTSWMIYLPCDACDCVACVRVSYLTGHGDAVGTTAHRASSPYAIPSAGVRAKIAIAIVRTREHLEICCCCCSGGGGSSMSPTAQKRTHTIHIMHNAYVTARTRASEILNHADEVVAVVRWRCAHALRPRNDAAANC